MLSSAAKCTHKQKARTQSLECGLIMLRLLSLTSRQEAAQVIRPSRMAELSQSLRFDLTNAFAGHVELLADFFSVWSVFI